MSSTAHNQVSFIHKKSKMFSVKCMELEDTMLSEISQTEKDKKHMFFLMQGDEKKMLLSVNRSRTRNS